MSEPYVSAEIRGKHVVLVNSSDDRPVGGIVWRFEDENTQSPLIITAEPQPGALVLPPRGTHPVAIWSPTFGYEPVKVVTRWVGEDGAPGQHTATLT